MNTAMEKGPLSQFQVELYTRRSAPPSPMTPSSANFLPKPPSSARSSSIESAVRTIKNRTRIRSPLAIKKKSESIFVNCTQEEFRDHCADETVERVTAANQPSSSIVVTSPSSYTDINSVSHTDFKAWTTTPVTKALPPLCNGNLIRGDDADLTTGISNARDSYQAPPANFKPNKRGRAKTATLKVSTEPFDAISESQLAFVPHPVDAGAFLRGSSLPDNDILNLRCPSKFDSTSVSHSAFVPHPPRSRELPCRPAPTLGSLGQSVSAPSTPESHTHASFKAYTAHNFVRAKPKLQNMMHLILSDGGSMLHSRLSENQAMYRQWDVTPPPLAPINNMKSHPPPFAADFEKFVAQSESSASFQKPNIDPDIYRRRKPKHSPISVLPVTEDLKSPSESTSQSDYKKWVVQRQLPAKAPSVNIHTSPEKFKGTSTSHSVFLPFAVSPFRRAKPPVVDNALFISSETILRRSTAQSDYLPPPSDSKPPLPAIPQNNTLLLLADPLRVTGASESHSAYLPFSEKIERRSLCKPSSHDDLVLFKGSQFDSVSTSATDFQPWAITVTKLIRRTPEVNPLTSEEPFCGTSEAQSAFAGFWPMDPRAYVKTNCKPRADAGVFLNSGGDTKFEAQSTFQSDFVEFDYIEPPKPCKPQSSLGCTPPGVVPAVVSSEMAQAFVPPSVDDPVVALKPEASIHLLLSSANVPFDGKTTKGEDFREWIGVEPPAACRHSPSIPVIPQPFQAISESAASFVPHSIDPSVFVRHKGAMNQKSLVFPLSGDKFMGTSTSATDYKLVAVSHSAV